MSSLPSRVRWPRCCRAAVRRRHRPISRVDWTPVNRYAAAPDEIPLVRAYVFAPSPLDRTLKTMLSRWAADSSRTLQYQHPSDFALYAPVTGIHTGRLEEALAMLDALYRQQHVVVTLDGTAIVVRQRNDTAVAATHKPDAPVH
jgi:hypothetical protein